MFQTRLRSGWLSALILTTFTCPAHSAAASSSTESRIRQGQLQVAENATRTGCFHLSTSDSKFASPISVIGLFGVLFWLWFIFLIAFSNSKPFRQRPCQGFENCVTRSWSPLHEVWSENRAGLKI